LIHIKPLQYYPKKIPPCQLFSLTGLPPWYILLTMMKQKDIAKKAGVTQAAVSRWLSGNRRPRLKKALELEKLFGFSAYIWLFGTPAEIRKALDEALPNSTTRAPSAPKDGGARPPER
jgi:DNA-binding XRE family transcriptional regulator